MDGRTIKLAGEQYDAVTAPHKNDRAVSEEEKQAAYADDVRGRFPGLSHRCESAVSCLDTTTPDANIVIDFYPDRDRIIIASACSGHGFKLSVAIGEVLSDLAVHGASNVDISSFSIERFKT